MKKNTASQVIGAQMITAADGTAFTGSVTCYVTGDGGTQAAGSVGSGACTHEGNGFHTYAPAQAETNYDHVAFTFTGTGAIPVTVQVYTTFPQTGDSYARLGAPAGASIAADIATVDTVVDSILDDTGTSGVVVASITAGAITAAAVATGAIDADAIAADAVTEIQSGLATAANLATVDTVVDGIKAVTDLLPDAGALTSIATAAALTTVDGVVDAIKAKTDSLSFTVAGQVDANIQYVNDVQVAGTGAEGDEWVPA